MRTLGTHLAGWLAARSARERTLLLAAAALTGMLLAGLAVLAVSEDRVRVAAHERELAAVQRLAATLRRDEPPAAVEDTGATSLLARLEATTDSVLGREHIASMTPAAGPVEDGLVEEHVALRVTDASLADTVRLLHALESGSPPLRVTSLTLRKHPDDPGRFEAAVEVTQLREAP